MHLCGESSNAPSGAPTQTRRASESVQTPLCASTPSPRRFLAIKAGFGKQTVMQHVSNPLCLDMSVTSRHERAAR